MSCRQSRLSNPIEAFISRMIAEGPPANRPPHIELELPVRLVIALFLGLLLAGCDRQKGDAPQGGGAPGGWSGPRLQGSAPTGRLDRSFAGTRAPAAGFEDPTGETVTLADFRGRPVLVNLWATWCAPCVVEMPTLDALAVREGEKLEVLTVSQDLQGQDKVDAFFEQRQFSMIEPYIDPEMLLMSELRIDTLPTTILYDADGKEVWRMSGKEDWTGERAGDLLKEAL